MSLSWDQVNAWRARQHQLHTYAEKGDMLEVVSRIGGVHAQLMSAAEMALAARVADLSPQDVQDALWSQRTLVKSWLMRGALHLINVRDFPLYVGALSTLQHFRRGSWLKYHQVTSDELEAIIAGVRDVLNETPMTREQLARALAEYTGEPELEELLQSGWGALLKPAAFQGYLCYGPSDGQNVTFLNPAEWIGDWEPVDPEQAKQEIARRYLRAYGPAAVTDFSRWLGLPESKVKQTLRALGDEVEQVEVEGWQAWALSADLDEMAATEAVRGVRLLSYFDPYVVSIYRHSDELLSKEQKNLIYRPQGWIYPVVLVDGKMAGVWQYHQQGSKMNITLEMFAPPAQRIREGIAAEAARLGILADTDVTIEYLENYG